MTLQSSLDHIIALAHERNATITWSIHIEAGVRLAVFWEDDHLPREAHLHFGPGVAWDDSTRGAPDSFEWAFIIDPARYMAATEEGLDDDLAGEEARRIVCSMEELDNYLCGRPYQWARPGAVGA